MLFDIKTKPKDRDTLSVQRKGQGQHREKEIRKKD
jgi:hypothetical protein